MERKNLTFGSIEELQEPLIVKEKDLEPIDTSSKSCSIDMVPQFIRASTPKVNSLSPYENAIYIWFHRYCMFTISLSQSYTQLLNRLSLLG